MKFHNLIQLYEEKKKNMVLKRINIFPNCLLKQKSCIKKIGKKTQPKTKTMNNRGGRYRWKLYYE